MTGKWSDLPCPQHGDAQQEEDRVFKPREARLTRPLGLVAVGVIVKRFVGGRAPLLEGIADTIHYG